MPAKTKKAVAPELGRKAAYVMRNRAALLHATQEVLAVKGQAATIEDIAEHAQIAVSTVYKHFKDKDALISATILNAFAEWESWAESLALQSNDPLEQLVLPMRLFVRLNKTHPYHAQTLVNYFGVAARIVPQLQVKLIAHVTALNKAKLLNLENPSTAAKHFHAVITFAVVEQVTNPKATEKDGDESVRAGLRVLGIPDELAMKLAHSPLSFETKR
jgi:AcrR family transcriptional regulator